MNKNIVTGDYMAEHQPLVVDGYDFHVSDDGMTMSLTRPVTEDDRYWIEALRAPSTVFMGHTGRLTRELANSFTPPAPPVRPIPCHPTRPLI